MDIDEIEERIDEINDEIDEVEFGILLNYLVAEGLVTIEVIDGEERIFPAEDPVYLDLEELYDAD